ncbi:unnamed protein product [Paramecium pentaurelia]|uniref:Uncharacterized protein n=1 Tax=Paramecium pentaurelia TaxID=43138 RepID=A0A8S1VLL6_9CILI|nr:unnamed protein product [Paramecium pentaurelia]
MLNLKTKKHSFSIQKRQYWTQNDNKLLEKVVKLHNSDSKTILLEEMEVNVHQDELRQTGDFNKKYIQWSHQKI